MIDIPTLHINSDRLKADMETLAEIGATVSGGVSRLALSNEDIEARAWFAECVEAAGLLLRDDEVGNQSAVLPCEDPQAPTLLIGSHLDTVPNGGRYDGAVGVMGALECLRTIREAGVRLPIHLEAINFTDEEGTWQSFFGSLGLTGLLSPEHVNDAQQDNGAFRAALFRAGIRPGDVHLARRDPASLLGYLELHVEQGDKLHSARVDIGLVTHIVGRTTYNLHFKGEAAHAGTTPLNRRRDALQGAALFIIRAHELVQRRYPSGVLNCGYVRVEPGMYNVIPSNVLVRMECRHPDEEILHQMEETLLDLAKTCAAEHGLLLQPERVLHRRVAKMAPGWLKVVEDVCKHRGISSMPVVSYAGHDAQIMSAIVPSAMIFIPSVDGISHNPREFTHWHHIETGTNILLQTVLEIALNGRSPG